MTYSQVGDYLLPDLALPETEHATIGKYGIGMLLLNGVLQNAGNKNSVKKIG
ncbi:TnpV protein [Pelotomaculum schinkii]|uniref:TnpV protein n=1 Tax=Pelotomaculum schinkii TaxID=78350 RepID=UPI003D08EF35